MCLSERVSLHADIKCISCRHHLKAQSALALQYGRVVKYTSQEDFIKEGQHYGKNIMYLMKINVAIKEEMRERGASG